MGAVPVLTSRTPGAADAYAARGGSPLGAGGKNPKPYGLAGERPAPPAGAVRPSAPGTGPARPSSPAAPVASPVASGYPAAPGMPGAYEPSYLAYMRGMGVDEANINVLLGHRNSALVRELGRGLPAYAAKREAALADVGSAFEDRGMYRSGGRMRSQTDAGIGVDRERLDFESGIRDQITENQLNASMDIAALRRQFLEQGLDSASATALASAQAGL